MLISAAPRSGLRQGLVALAAAVLVFALPARADDLQDATKLLKGGQHSQALERVNRVLSSKPRDPQARFLKGLILTEQGNTREAIDIFSKLTQDFPELPEPFNNLAVIYASQGQYEKARTALEQSIRTHPSYATAYENLGDVYAKLASQAYDKALQIDSSNAGAQNKLSLVRELVGGPATGAKPPVVVAQKSPAPETAPAEKPPAPKPAEKVAPQKPAVAEKAPAAKPADNPGGEVVAAVNGWAQAWSKKDANGYLSYYAKDFKTPGTESRAEWEKARRARITAPKSISVAIGSPKVTMSGANRATVTFRQTYRSDVLKSTNTKTLVMVKNEGRWQIEQERSGGG
jgi:tetratricopeptide (TPR) repeat protein